MSRARDPIEVTFGRARHPGERAPSTRDHRALPPHRVHKKTAAKAACFFGAGEGIRTLDVHLGKVKKSVSIRFSPFQILEIA
jgi:hypothetical protein